MFTEGSENEAETVTLALAIVDEGFGISGVDLVAVETPKVSGGWICIEDSIAASSRFFSIPRTSGADERPNEGFWLLVDSPKVGTLFCCGGVTPNVGALDEVESPEGTVGLAVLADGNRDCCAPANSC